MEYAHRVSGRYSTARHATLGAGDPLRNSRRRSESSPVPQMSALLRMIAALKPEDRDTLLVLATVMVESYEDDDPSQPSLPPSAPPRALGCPQVGIPGPALSVARHLTTQ